MMGLWVCHNERRWGWGTRGKGSSDNVAELSPTEMPKYSNNDSFEFFGKLILSQLDEGRTQLQT